MDKSLIRIGEDEIKEILSEHYGIHKDGICLYCDYEFIRKGDDKKRRDFVYGIVDLRATCESPMEVDDEKQHSP